MRLCASVILAIYVSFVSFDSQCACFSPVYSAYQGLLCPPTTGYFESLDVLIGLPFVSSSSSLFDDSVFWGLPYSNLHWLYFSKNI